MKKKIPLCLALAASTFVIIACSDSEPDREKICGRAILKYGAKDCSALGGPAATGSSGGTATSTVTVTVTN